MEMVQGKFSPGAWCSVAFRLASTKAARQLQALCMHLQALCMVSAWYMTKSWSLASSAVVRLVLTRLMEAGVVAAHNSTFLVQHLLHDLPVHPSISPRI